jgi:hypothetical protein
MLVPAFALLVLLLGILSPHVVLPGQMVLMLPSMIVVMLHRVDEYSGHARAPALVGAS